MKVLHVITGLGDGGAEACLYRLINETHRITDHYVVALRSRDKYSKLLSQNGIPVFHLNIDSPLQIIKQSFDLYSLIKKINPDIIQTWLYHADFLGGILGKIAHKKVIWGIHNTTLEFGKSSTTTILLVRILSLLSYFIPEKIISCSIASSNSHTALGYCKKKFITIHNGVDTNSFYQSHFLRNQFRTELKIQNSDLCIGMVARNDPQKDYSNFISALAELHAQNFPFKCVIAGSNTNQLQAKVKSKKLENNILILGQRKNIQALMNGLDLLVLSSAYGEACPNVLLEAMACGVPCVATNLGDCKYILGDTGVVVEPKNHQQLSQAICNLAQNLSKELSCQCMNRISQHFTLSKMVASYKKVWESSLFH